MRGQHLDHVHHDARGSSAYGRTGGTAGVYVGDHRHATVVVAPFGHLHEELRYNGSDAREKECLAILSWLDGVGYKQPCGWVWGN